MVELRKKAQADSWATARTSGEIVVGWRCWAEHHGVLLSPYRQTAWPKGRRLESPVDSSLSPLVARGHGRGIYALRDQHDVLVWVAMFPTLTIKWPQSRGKNLVWGTVSLWGKVVEHEGGYRAQYAYPLECWTTSQEAASRIRGSYGVDAYMIARSDEE